MGTGKKKIEIKKIEKDGARMVTFSKRRQDLFKKAREYATKTSSQVAILVFSPAGKPYVHGSPCFDTVIEKSMRGDKTVDMMNGGGGRGGEGGDEAGVGSDCDVEGMFSGLEERMRSCESVEESMEVRSILEKMRDKVLQRLNDVRKDMNNVQKDVNYSMQEDDVTVSLYSCDSEDDFVASLLEDVNYVH